MKHRCMSAPSLTVVLPDASPLVELEQPDVWVRGLRCAGGHEWWERGHRIWMNAGERRVTVVTEMSDDTLRFFIRNWLRRSRAYVEEQLGTAIVRALERFLEDE